MMESTSSTSPAVVLVLLVIAGCFFKMLRKVTTSILIPVTSRSEQIRRQTWLRGGDAVRWVESLFGADNAWVWLGKRGGAQFVPLADAAKRHKISSWSGCVLMRRGGRGARSPEPRRLGARSRVLVWYCGNGYVGEDVLPLLRQHMDSYDLDAVVTWNVTGTSHGSDAETFSQLVEDACTAVSVALDNLGASQQGTLIHGHSLGGAIAVHVQGFFPGCGLVADRTFGHLAHIANHHINGGSGGAARKVLELVMWLIGWDAEVGRKVASSAAPFRLLLHHADDEIIPPRLQLTKGGSRTIELTGRSSSPHGMALRECAQFGEVVRHIRSEFFGRNR